MERYLGISAAAMCRRHRTALWGRAAARLRLPPCTGTSQRSLERFSHCYRRRRGIAAKRSCISPLGTSSSALERLRHSLTVTGSASLLRAAHFQRNAGGTRQARARPVPVRRRQDAGAARSMHCRSRTVCRACRLPWPPACGRSASPAESIVAPVTPSALRRGRRGRDRGRHANPFGPALVRLASGHKREG